MDSNKDSVRSIFDLIKKDDSTSSDVDITVENGMTKEPRNESGGFQNPNYENVNENQSIIPTDITIIEKEPEAQPDSTDGGVTLSKWRKPRELKLKFFVFLLFLIIVSGVAVIFHFYERKEANVVELGTTIKLDEKQRKLTIQNGPRQVLEGMIGLNIKGFDLPYNCPTGKSASEEWCLRWQNNSILQVAYSIYNSTTCYDVMWRSLAKDIFPKDCFDISTSYWYGGSLNNQQRWPLGRTMIPMQPFLSGSTQSSSGLGPVLESYWLSSDGLAIYVADDHPLHVSFNDPNEMSGAEKLCLSSDYNTGPYKNPDNSLPFLNYTVCVDSDMKKVHKHIVNQFLFQPEGQVDKTPLKEPVWSTRTSLTESNFSQATVENFGQEINKTITCEQCLLVVEGPWEKAYGDLEFDSMRFPDHVGMKDNLQQMGFKVALSVTPYISTDSKNFKSSLDHGYLVKDSGNQAPGLKKVYDGPKQNSSYRGLAGVIDLYDKPYEWYKGKLNDLQNHYVTFRFLSGDVDALPADPNFANEHLGPYEYTRQYIDLASEYGNKVQVQCGTKTQKKSVFVQMYDKNSAWNSSVNGLQSIIPSVLTLGILGYPFIIPDVIGGSGFYGKPSSELYIRWAQLSAFLPTMQFSILPSDIEKNSDENVSNIVKSLIDIHRVEVYPIIEKLLNDEMEPLYPIIRPLWWIEPDTTEAQTIDDEFLVGNEMLVAPIVKEGKTERDIYLPSGRWKSRQPKHRDIEYAGPVWIRNVTIPLDEVAYFVKIE